MCMSACDYSTLFTVLKPVQFQCVRTHGNMTLQSDLLCVKWDVKLYLLTHTAD